MPHSSSRATHTGTDCSKRRARPSRWRGASASTPSKRRSTLRDGGITKPILVLGPVPPDALDDVMAAKLDLALWDTGEFARRLANAARKQQTRAPVHVKVNTGLNRLGFEPHELADAIEDYLHVSEIEIAGVFSHLSSAEELDSPSTMHQLETFERALAATEPLFERHRIVPLRHIAASAAAILWPQTRLDLSRFGIALYGLWPSKATREAADSNGVALEPALSYESEIVVVRPVSAGAPIGYGASYHAPRDMRVGVVPVGYGDGVPRALSNRGAFLVDGALCPIVGRVAMNLTEIDLRRRPRRACRLEGYAHRTRRRCLRRRRRLGELGRNHQLRNRRAPAVRAPAHLRRVIHFLRLRIELRSMLRSG